MRPSPTAPDAAIAELKALALARAGDGPDAEELAAFMLAMALASLFADPRAHELNDGDGAPALVREATRHVDAERPARRLM